jgi:hypothetical protein
MSTFNLYCDESCHLENDSKKFMLLSYVGIPYNKVHVLKEALYNIKLEHDFKSEIKWTNIYAGKERFYFDLIDFFFSTDLIFRALVIQKEKIDNANYNDDFDEFYYRMYYQLLYHKINMEHNYNIYLDIKDTLSAYKTRKLKDILKIDYTSIRNIQNIQSKESIFMQLADFFMGAINYKLNVPDEDKTGRVSKLKIKLIERIEKASGHTLDRSTSKSRDKFNLFFIELKS